MGAISQAGTSLQAVFLLDFRLPHPGTGGKALVSSRQSGSLMTECGVGAVMSCAVPGAMIKEEERVSRLSDYDK